MGLFHLAYQAVMEPVGACLLETGQNAGRALRDAAAHRSGPSAWLRAGSIGLPLAFAPPSRLLRAECRFAGNSHRKAKMKLRAERSWERK